MRLNNDLFPTLKNLISHKNECLDSDKEKMNTSLVFLPEQRSLS